MDATYRSDLRELNELNFARFDAKLEQAIATLRGEMRTGFAEQRADPAPLDVHLLGRQRRDNGRARARGPGRRAVLTAAPGDASYAGGVPASPFNRSTRAGRSSRPGTSAKLRAHRST